MLYLDVQTSDVKAVSELFAEDKITEDQYKNIYSEKEIEIEENLTKLVQNNSEVFGIDTKLRLFDNDKKRYFAPTYKYLNNLKHIYIGELFVSGKTAYQLSSVRASINAISAYEEIINKHIFQFDRDDVNNFAKSLLTKGIRPDTVSWRISEIRHLYDWYKGNKKNNPFTGISIRELVRENNSHDLIKYSDIQKIIKYPNKTPMENQGMIMAILIFHGVRMEAGKSRDLADNELSLLKNKNITKDGVIVNGRHIVLTKDENEVIHNRIDLSYG